MTDDFEIAASWSTPVWREEATGWLDQTLAEAGLKRIGSVTQPHLEPWSTVLTANTSGGRVWLKAMVPGTAFEIEIYDLLTRIDPEHVLHPIASDRDRGWLLLPDGGPSVAERFKGAELVEAMVIALPQYASLQRSMTASAQTLIETGLGDMRTEGLPSRYRHARARLEGEPFADKLVALEADYLAWWDTVSGSPIPPTLDHNDLHPWNILGVGSAPSDEPDRAVFYDWGDSVVAHPLGSAHVPIARVRKMVGLDSEHPDALLMRDAYLEVFTDLVSRSQLVELFEASCRLAKATRAVIWDGSPEDIGHYLADLSNGFAGM